MANLASQKINTLWINVGFGLCQKKNAYIKKALDLDRANSSIKFIRNYV